jgi:hypothetical protein
MSTKSNIVIDQGADFILEVTALDADDEEFDFNGYTVEAQMKKHYESANSVTFTSSISNNAIHLSLTAEQTKDITPGRYNYDVLITSSDDIVIRLLEGIATVTPGITGE